MDLLDRFKFLDAHFNGEETKHDITELRNEVMKYDVYDVMRIRTGERGEKAL